MADGDDGLGVAPTARRPQIAFGQVGALGAGRRAGRLHEGRSQPLGPLAGSADPRFPADSRCPGHIPAHEARCPGVGKTPMSAPISARITSADRRSHPDQTGNRSIWVAKGRTASSIAQSRARRCRLLGPRREPACGPAGRRGGPGIGGQRLAELGQLGSQPALGQLGEDLGSFSPAMRARIIARPETPRTSVATVASFMPASSRVLWIRLTWRVCSPMRALR